MLCWDSHSLRCLCATGPECGSGALDLVFVIDGSKSLGAANFELVKQFVSSMVDSLDISRTGTRVGLLQYSTAVRAEFPLNRYSTAQEVQRAVAQVRYMGRGSMTGSALRHMFQSSFTAAEGARPDVPRVSVVFTDGRSQDDVSQWARKAKNSGSHTDRVSSSSLDSHVLLFKSSSSGSVMSFRGHHIRRGCWQSRRAGAEGDRLGAGREAPLLR